MRRPRWKRLLILISGWAFIVLGVLGIFLPFLQGFLFLAIGFYLLSLESVWAQRLLDRMRARWPKLARAMDDARDRIARFTRRGRR
ncbi:MAG: PGPGW domain-containing protein [Alphaproteobacteria bacterium]